MSTKKPSSSSETTKAAYVPVQWANIYLSREQKLAAHLWGENGEVVANVMETCLTSGYKVSFAFNEKTDSAICSITGSSCGGDNQGWGMSTHARGWYEAMVLALYKHGVLGADMSYAEMAVAFTLELP